MPPIYKGYSCYKQIPLIQLILSL